MTVKAILHTSRLTTVKDYLNAPLRSKKYIYDITTAYFDLTVNITYFKITNFAFFILLI